MDKIERAYNLIDEVEYSKAKKIGEELISEGNSWLLSSNKPKSFGPSRRLF